MKKEDFGFKKISIAEAKEVLISMGWVISAIQSRGFSERLDTEIVIYLMRANGEEKISIGACRRQDNGEDVLMGVLHHERNKLNSNFIEQAEQMVDEIRKRKSAA